MGGEENIGICITIQKKGNLRIKWQKRCLYKKNKQGPQGPQKLITIKSLKIQNLHPINNQKCLPQ